MPGTVFSESFAVKEKYDVAQFVSTYCHPLDTYNFSTDKSFIRRFV